MTAPLSWFGAFNKTDWDVGKAREAHANVRGGRFQIIRRDAECFVVRWCPPFRCPDMPWTDIGMATTAEAAIALAEAHNMME
jgi:hypothetical protein